MNSFIAALPMYDWPEVRAEVDAEWARLREAFRYRGIDAPEKLVRCNADMPPVPGGIRDGAVVLAPDPATLPPEQLDLHVLWRHPRLLFAQTCWGPMGQGLAEQVQVIGQPDYSAFESGQGAFYSSAVVMRRDEALIDGSIAAPPEGGAVLPVDLLRGKRFAYNGADSMSGVLALTGDLEAMGENLGIFADRMVSGGHRASIVAVAKGKADVAAIDCRSWAMAQRLEPAAKDVQVIGWTARRKGLPYICARTLPPETVAALREAAGEVDMLAST